MSQDLVRVLGVKQNRLSASFLGVGESTAVSILSAADIRISATPKGENRFDTSALTVSKITSYIPECRLPINS